MKNYSRLIKEVKIFKYGAKAPKEVRFVLQRQLDIRYHQMDDGTLALQGVFHQVRDR